jgi:hypothetical protein
MLFLFSAKVFERIKNNFRDATVVVSYGLQANYSVGDLEVIKLRESSVRSLLVGLLLTY